MKVIELVELMSQFDQELEVRIVTTDYDEFEVTDVEEDAGFVFVEVEPI